VPPPKDEEDGELAVCIIDKGLSISVVTFICGKDLRRGAR